MLIGVNAMTERTAKLRAALRICEREGLLNRVMVPYPIHLDGESGKTVLPPRLFYLPKFDVVAHSIGDDSFYLENPEYKVGGVSKEIYIMEKAPACLSNYFALEEQYSRVEKLVVKSAIGGRG